MGGELVSLGTGALVSLGILGRDLLSRALGPAADEVGEHLQGRIAGFLGRNVATTVNQAADLVAASGQEPHELPLRTGLPLLEGASREDDPAMQERWAALLANAVVSPDPDDIPPQFATILSRLTPLAASVLAVLAESTQPDDGSGLYVRTDFLSLPTLTHRILPQEGGVAVAERELLREQRVQAAVDILVSQGLATRGWAEATPSSFISPLGPKLEHRISALGLRFVRAVQPPAEKVRPEEPAS